MEIEYFDKCEHRPRPYLLVGFSQREMEDIRNSIRVARKWGLDLEIGPDGLTDKDRKLVLYARQIVDDWSAIRKLALECKTSKARGLMVEEMHRAFANLLKRKNQNSMRNQYDG